MSRHKNSFFTAEIPIQRALCQQAKSVGYIPMEKSKAHLQEAPRWLHYSGDFLRMLSQTFSSVGSGKTRINQVQSTGYI